MSRSTGPRTRRLTRRTGALVLALGLLTACSGGDDDTGSPTSAAAPSTAEESTPGTAAESSAESGETQTVTATEGEMFIELSEDSFTAGSYTFEVVNEGSATHDFVVERDGSDVTATDTIAPGDSATLTLDLEPGEYVFYCSIGDHRAEGMEVTVTVT